MALSTEAFEALMDQIRSMLDSDPENNLTNEQVIELQNALDTYMSENEIATQTETDWKTFCFDLMSHLRKGYEISVWQGDAEIGTLTSDLFDQESTSSSASDDDTDEENEQIEVLPEILQDFNIIRFPAPAGYSDSLIEDPDEYIYEALATDPDGEYADGNYGEFDW